LRDTSVNWTPKNQEAMAKYTPQIEKIIQTLPEAL